jgi:hypothetical protein
VAFSGLERQSRIRTLLEFQSRFATESACAQYLFERLGRTDLSAPVAAEVALGGFRPKPSLTSAPIAVGRPR